MVPILNIKEFNIEKSVQLQRAGESLFGLLVICCLIFALKEHVPQYRKIFPLLLGDLNLYEITVIAVFVLNFYTEFFFINAVNRLKPDSDDYAAFNSLAALSYSFKRSSGLQKLYILTLAMILLNYQNWTTPTGMTIWIVLHSGMGLAYIWSMASGMAALCGVRSKNG